MLFSARSSFSPPVTKPLDSYFCLTHLLSTTVYSLTVLLPHTPEDCFTLFIFRIPPPSSPLPPWRQHNAEGKRSSQCRDLCQSPVFSSASVHGVLHVTISWNLHENSLAGIFPRKKNLFSCHFISNSIYVNCLGNSKQALQ